ncbi:hypothetical protein Verru16b_02782 [Lacunisphaera limnophila]|uniref:Beta-mannosidase-like galactose-binding domain-containing protein n=1 Tax=Lacunisphaera limnophila TaxID=1838286 RepID=A0A1D8AXT5_9BACT|nr:glycosyl hydrolase [Lacunisphaera limnophila]AOS45695.1 hypothetical protein Verru16b_02782 [Lacunisphaera limnophila]
MRFYRFLILFASISATAVLFPAEERAMDTATFAAPPRAVFPETWFHLIGGNVSREGLTADIDAVAAAGLAGIQLFHGAGGVWPGVTPQIQTLSPSWDGMLEHVADEAKRAGLRFTMQNCPGWAMSGGPWITPDRAMRHLVWSRVDVGAESVEALRLPVPQPSKEEWRDYRDVAVLAFPTPEGDTGGNVAPVAIRSNRPDLPWAKLWAGSEEVPDLRIEPAGVDPVWVEVEFAGPLVLRSAGFPGIERFAMRRNFDPSARIQVRALVESAEGAPTWRTVADREVPRGNWQDRPPQENAWVLALDEQPARVYRFVFHNRKPLALLYLRLSTAARLQDWAGQAGFVLRSLDRSGPPRQSPAAWVRGADVLDLSEHLRPDGTLDWRPREGRWTVVRYGHVNTGVTNTPAPPEATGWECDKLSPLGAEQHFAGYIGRVSAPGGPVDGGRLQGMLIDSWECYTQTWTPAMEAEFATRREYALRRWLPALAGWVIDDPLTTERFLRDWRATISDLLVANYFGRLAELARERGLRLFFEAATGDVTPGDLLEYYQAADVPMCEFWRPNDPHWGGLEAKPFSLAVSAGHIYGKPVIAAEAFTNILLDYSEHPFQFKASADRAFAAGVNHLVLHTYTHNPRLDLVPGTSFGSRIGSPFIRGQTWWQHMPAFTTYLARCQAMLQQGVPVADVLWYVGDDLDQEPRADTPYPSGYKFDLCNQDALLRRISVDEAGRLTTPEGVSWRLLWLPQDSARRLTVPTLQRLRGMLEAGAVVLAERPQQRVDLSGGPAADAAFDQLVSALWGNVPSPSGEALLGRGRLRWGVSLETMLGEIDCGPDVAGVRATEWTHRRVDGENIYFVAADRATPLRANVRFRATGRPELWDAVTGQIHPVPVFARVGGVTSVPLDLPAAGSVFVRFRAETAPVAWQQVERDGTVLLDGMDATRTEAGVPFPVQGLQPGAEEQPWIPQPWPDLTVTPAGLGGKLVAWRDGNYTMRGRGWEPISERVEVRAAQVLNAGWKLQFPSGWDAPSELNLADGVQPWSAHANPAIAAFSGTAVYSTNFTVSSLAGNERAWLDLGRVSEIAEVELNGQILPLAWTAPHQLDVSAALRAGENRLKVHVTNTWFNRLAYEAGLPATQRRTWSINGPVADAPRRLAGLTGPVRLVFGRILAAPTAP